ncbi:MAG: hypothetical protein U0572_00845 [Phycisphaerales bacterium]
MLTVLVLGFTLARAPQENAAPAPASPLLPVAWHGTWRGELEIASTPAQRVPMELDIQPLDGGKRLTWRMTYGDGASKQVRAYELLPGDAPNRFVIDEKNGILIDQRLEGSTMVSAFEVQGNLLVSREELVGDELRFEITTYAAAKPRESAVGEGDAKTTVKSYPSLGYQRAVLKRQ